MVRTRRINDQAWRGNGLDDFQVDAKYVENVLQIFRQCVQLSPKEWKAASHVDGDRHRVSLLSATSKGTKRRSGMVSLLADDCCHSRTIKTRDVALADHFVEDERMAKKKAKKAAPKKAAGKKSSKKAAKKK